MATPPIVSPFPQITPKRYQRVRSIVQSKASFFVVPRSRLTAWISESKSKDLSSVFLFSFSFSRSLLRRNGGFSSSKEPEATAEDEFVTKGGSSMMDVNRKPEIRFSVLKPKSGFRFWKPNFEFIFLNSFYLWKIA